MTASLSLRDVMSRAVELKPADVVAIALELIASLDRDHEPSPPFGPPTVDSVYLEADGSVVCRSCAATPGVLEVGILLNAMLPCGGVTTVPGGLRYTIARALLEVDAPPFDSMTELSSALKRHEQGDRGAVLRTLYERAAAATPNVVSFEVERRRGPSVAELRRQLRQADEERFSLFRTSTEAMAEAAAIAEADSPVPFAFDPLILRAEPPAPSLADKSFKARPWLVGGAIAASIAFGAGYALVNEMRSMGASARPTTALERPASPSKSTPEANAPAVGKAGDQDHSDQPGDIFIWR
jgi:hypothetical protein